MAIIPEDMINILQSKLNIYSAELNKYLMKNNIHI